MKAFNFISLIGLHLLTSAALFGGGAFIYEIATPDLGLASAGWSARADDPSTVFTNPAGMTRLDCAALQGGLELIYNHVKFNPDAGTTFGGGSGDASALIPSGSLFYVTPISENCYVGVGSLGYFGSLLDYGDTWSGRYYLNKVWLQGFSVVPSVAYRVNNCLSVGVGANVMYGVLDQHASVNNSIDGLTDGILKIKDERFGVGADVGILLQLSSCTRFGMQYLSQVNLNFKAKPEFQNLGPTLNTVLTDVGIINSHLNVKVNVPNTLMLSGYHELNSCFAVLGNVGWQQWSKFNKVELSLAGEDTRTISYKPKYKDTWHVAAGLEYFYSERLTLTCGTAYDSSAVSEKERTPSFPVGEQWRFGTGFLYLWKQNVKLSAGYECMWSGNLPMSLNRGPLAGKLSGNFNSTCTHFLDVGLTYIF